MLSLSASARSDDPAVAPPKGEVVKYTFDQSKIFPGTVRDYWIYVPQQYGPAKPACVFVCQDGVQYKAPEVFDKLIHSKEMPVTIGVFIMHGRVKAESDKSLDRFNRSYEYDGLGDVTGYPLLFAELLRRGYTDEEVLKIAGRNHLRAMRQMEKVAEGLQKTEAALVEEAPAK